MATLAFSDDGAVRADRIVAFSRTCGDTGAAAQRLLSGIPANSGSGSISIVDPRSADVVLGLGRWYINVLNTSGPGDFLLDYAN